MVQLQLDENGLRQGHQVRSKEKAEGKQLKKSHNLGFSKVLPLEFLIVVKINMPFQATPVPSYPLHDRRDWGSERMNACPQEGDNKESRRSNLESLPSAEGACGGNRIRVVNVTSVSPPMGVLLLL